MPTSAIYFYISSTARALNAWRGMTLPRELCAQYEGAETISANVLLRQSRSQRLHSFWSAPRMQDLWDNQCQNADESKSDWLLKFTGSLQVRSFKTGNENALWWFCWTFLITPETASGKEIRKWAIRTPKESKNSVRFTFMLDKT